MSLRPSDLADRFATGLLRGGALFIGLMCLLPMVAVAVAALLGSTDTLRHLAETVLWTYTATTLQLVVIVALGTAAIGTGAAWLVTMTRFPGARFFEIALALPLAFPAYVMGYAYTHFLDHPGPVQTLLRDVTGWGPRDYWFPEVRSVTGAAVMLILVLYPYVYLLARAAFLQQSATAFLAARALGRGPWTAFLRVSLPMARPAIAGGVLLAVMETIADYGTTSYFAVQTFATGIYTSWFTMADRAAAAQLALCLLGFALLLAILERMQRGAARHHGAGKRFERLPPTQLAGPAKWGATLLCAVPVLLGFILPVALLLSMGIGSGQSLMSPRYVGYIRNTIVLAGTASVLTVIGAVLVGFRMRLWPGPASSGASHLARIGYAVPGGVIAVGLLVPFAAFDNALDAWMRATFGLSTGLLFTGSIWLLVCAYMVRFMAAALNTYDSGLGTIHPNIDAVARTLGTRPTAMLQRIHVPVLRPSVLTALLIVFVDVMKELPATLIMRPFNFDTLAVQAHRLASDERLDGAAVPSLAIVAVGLLPVILVCRSLGAKRSRVFGTAATPAE
ncbi:ABC transporter permease [Tropicimonas sediminicola]|uniref:Iron(III) transport system permease protein n=1 Tax=Tropicimonas sediminicola TaxID=1031541 RepID=A0A239DCH6_9RHOB|nr:iron ABC transporter permease [Tropicimonas sediminicola]SNS29997.1 iron(III) transport system permease protein [Tropicimonas sediminicola]